MSSQQRGASLRSQLRRSELIATGRKLFAHTSYDALSMDDIARHAGVAKGLIYYYFKNKRGYYLAIVEDSVAELVSLAAGGGELPRTERVRRTVEAYLRFAQENEAAYRTIITGGVGFDTQVQEIRDAVRTGLVATVAQGAYGRHDIPPIARLALLGWLSSVEWLTLEWLEYRDDLRREVPRDLLVRMLRHTLNTIEEFAPECPAPPPDPQWRPFTGRTVPGGAGDESGESGA
ncbi:TetR/AcrR family transcriptional regulator [Streptomyces sp. NPDC012623]|uniref:TetR/AcrR family transcriptional regulator n=1 Tax=unclassified Streptomyces TaxID=2593676 RepID=UPI0036BB4E2D